MENVSIQNWNMVRKSYEVFQKKFLKKSFHGHVEHSFDNPAESFWPMVRKVLAVTPKGMEKTCFLKKRTFFFQTDAQGSLRAVLTNPSELFC